MIGASSLRIPGILTVLLIITGLATRSSAVLAIAIPPMVYLAVVLVFSRGARLTPNSLHASRRPSQLRCIEGDEMSITTELRSSKRLLVVMSDQAALDALPLTIEGPTSGAFRLPAMHAHAPDPRRKSEPPAAATLRYTIRSDRGEFHIAGTRVTSFSPCPLTPQTAILDDRTTVRVVPHAWFVPPLRIQPQRTRVYAGSVKTNLGGSGLDFFGCRDYSPGDSTRAINWRIVARTGSLVVNEFEQERIADVSVILDCRTSTYARAGAGAEAGRLFDDSVRAAASLAIQFLHGGNRVGLLMYGDIPDWVYPGVGRLQQVQIRDALSRARTGDREAFRALRNLPTRLIPPGAQLVIISPLTAFDDATVLSELRALGYEILLVCPFVSEPSASASADALAGDLAARTMCVLRTSQMTTVRRAGVQVVEWDTSRPLADAVAQLRHGRRRGMP